MHRIGPATLLLFALSVPAARGGDAQRLRPYVEALQTVGTDPLEFVLNVFATHDLVLFDDALHTAVEPFEFYERLIREPRFQARYVFLETVSITQQPALDAYLAADEEDRTLLHPAFQNDFSGFGWRYQTYFSLLSAIREVNRTRAPEDRLRVLAVNAPVYWDEIDSPADLDLFRLSLASNDCTMVWSSAATK